jgi:hypothetical protein
VPSFQIRLVNSDYEACNDVDASDFEAARKQALRAALEIGAEELCGGTPFFGAEVSVELDGKLKERFLVSIGQSPLR